MADKITDKKQSKMKYWIVKAFFLYSLFIAFVYYIQRDLMYFPTKEVYQASQYNLDGFKEFSVKTKDGLSIKAFKNFDDDSKSPVIVFFHGNGGHVGHRTNKIKPLSEAGFNIILTEYRGYGPNKGEITEENIYKDARAYLDTVKNVNVILYGESLGSAVAVQMATEYENITAIILETPFDSTLNLAKKGYWFVPMLSTIMHDKYENDKKISEINIPKLVFLAGKDEVVGIESGKRLVALMDDNKTVIIHENAGHNDMINYNISTQIIEFISKL